LQSSDLVVVFTDGVVEAENEREEEYGRLAD
jgi:serine phosphatase RsbU (regulator of sigma subunit)